MQTALLCSMVCSLLAIGCATPHPLPPVVLETEHGLIRAQSHFTAETVAEMLEQSPEIKERLESTRADLPQVWLLASARAHLNGALGACGPDRIQLGFDALLDLQGVLMHELVHWYVLDSPFAGLPHFIEEGLADYLAVEMTSVATGLGADFTLSASYKVSIREFSMTGAEARSLPMERYIELCEVGACVVSLLGLERVRELAAANAEPVSYLAAMGTLSSGHD